MGYGESEQPADDREHGSMLGMFFFASHTVQSMGEAQADLTL